MMFLQVPWVASHTESCDLSCKVGYPSRRNIPAYSSPSEVSPITLPDEFLGCDRSSIWAASWNLGQDCAVGTTKKQKSQALLKQCEKLLFILFGAYYTFQWEDLLKVVDNFCGRKCWTKAIYHGRLDKLEGYGSEINKIVETCWRHFEQNQNMMFGNVQH